MKILITGITGLLGSYIAKRFSSIGKIYGLKRPESDLRLLGDFADHVQWHDGDITDYQSLEAAIEDKDLIIHAAGLVSFKSVDNEKLMKINVEGTANLVNAMLDKGIKKIIHISSVSALGRSPGVSFIDENHKWVNSHLNTPYSISKYLAELEVWRAAQEGLDVMVVLPSVILGKISDSRSSKKLYNYVLKGNKYYPKGKINYLDVRDCVEIILQLFQKGVWGNSFILNNQSLPYKVFFEKMARAFGKKAPTRVLNHRMLRLAMTLSWIGGKFGMDNILNSQTAKISQLKITMNNQKVQNLLDYRFTPIENTFQWAKTNENN